MPRLTFAWIAIVVVVLIAVFQPLNAGWMRTYGGEEYDVGECVQQTTDGGYIVTGYTYSFGHDLWLLKIESDGNTQWTRTYGDTRSDEGYYVQQTNDGGYIITGSTDLDTSVALWILKTDSMGITLWSKVYGEEMQTHKGRCVQRTSDGGYIVTGYTYPPEGKKIWLLKTDSLGDTLWTKKFGGTEIGFSVRETSDGGYVVSGGSASFGCLTLLKTDSYGDTLWVKRYCSGMGDAGFCVQETTDGGFVVAGMMTTDTVDGYPEHTALWLLKTDSYGDTLWTKTYRENRFDCGYYVEQTTDGGYIITGYKGRNMGIEALWLIKTDSMGDTMWTRSWGEGWDYGTCVRQTKDGGYIITGITKSFGDSYGDLWLIKTDSLGYVSVEEKPIVKSVVNWEIVTSIGPQIVLRYTNPPEGFHASVFDVIGRKVDELHSDGISGTITWGESMSPGVYFIRTSSDKPTITHKVVLID